MGRLLTKIPPSLSSILHYGNDHSVSTYKERLSLQCCQLIAATQMQIVRSTHQCLGAFSLFRCFLGPRTIFLNRTTRKREEQLQGKASIALLVFFAAYIKSRPKGHTLHFAAWTGCSMQNDFGMSVTRTELHKIRNAPLLHRMLHNLVTSSDISLSCAY